MDIVIIHGQPSFMNYLSKGQEISFKDIQNDIYYLLDQGTYVEDFMGLKEKTIMEMIMILTL